MASIVLGWAEFKSYLATVGPGIGRPARPSVCPFCDGERVWFDGWRCVFAVVLADGTPYRFADGLWIQRVCCAECGTSWPLRPAFLYPHRSLEPDVAEAAALTYLSEAGATYAAVASEYGCSARTIWRWVGWIAGLVVVGELLAEAERLTGAGQAAAIVPRAVPQDHAKALSAERGATLLAAFQALVALAVWARAQPVPPGDPSAVRTWLAARFLARSTASCLVRVPVVAGRLDRPTSATRAPVSFDDDIDDRRRRIALFRHAVIGELDFEGLARGEISARVAELAARMWQPPTRRERRFSARTLWSWWSAYKREGLKGLLPQSRKSGPREVTPDILAAAIKARSEVPSRSTVTLIDVLETQQLVPRGKLRRSTLDRHLEAAGASRRRLKTLGDKVYTRLLFEHPNDFWVGDYHEAPILWVPEHQRYRTVHMSAFVDHYSKVVPHAQWYTNEQVGTLEDTFKKAALKRGLSAKVYVDRGPAFRSDDFGFACAHLDVRRVHSKPYAKEARGAIERFNRTIAEGFEPEVRAARVDDLDRINLLFEAWLEQRYHLVPHGTTGEPPLDRFAQPGFTPRYPDPVLLQDVFRLRVKRKVHPKTATVEVDGVFFQCESFLRGRWVRVFYDPFKLDDVLVFLGDRRVQRAFPQKVNAPQPAPERPVAAPSSFDYLGALRAEFDRRIVEQAKHLSLSEWKPSETFTLKPFLDLCAQMLGKDLSVYEREELTRSFNGVGPFSEKTVRLALEHALKLRGRGLHVSVYSHYLKTFHLAAIKSHQE